MTEKVWTTSMMTKKSRVEMVICCEGDAEMLDLATSVGAVVLGVEGSGGVEDTRAMGNRVVVAGAGTEDAGT